MAKKDDTSARDSESAVGKNRRTLDGDETFTWGMDNQPEIQPELTVVFTWARLAALAKRCLIALAL